MVRKWKIVYKGGKEMRGSKENERCCVRGGKEMRGGEWFCFLENTHTRVDKLYYDSKYSIYCWIKN